MGSRRRPAVGMAARIFFVYCRKSRSPAHRPLTAAQVGTLLSLGALATRVCVCVPARCACAEEERQQRGGKQRTIFADAPPDRTVPPFSNIAREVAWSMCGGTWTGGGAVDVRRRVDGGWRGVGTWGTVYGSVEVTAGHRACGPRTITIVAISASPTACPLRGYGRAGTERRPF